MLNFFKVSINGRHNYSHLGQTRLLQVRMRLRSIAFVLYKERKIMPKIYSIGTHYTKWTQNSRIFQSLFKKDISQGIPNLEWKILKFKDFKMVYEPFLGSNKLISHSIQVLYLVSFVCLGQEKCHHDLYCIFPQRWNKLFLAFCWCLTTNWKFLA